jgi:ketosteroid isomerase-like protein
MSVSTAMVSSNDVRAFIEEYFEAWSGTDEDLILSYYSETISLEIPGTIIHGKAALRDQFVALLSSAFLEIATS